MSRKTLFITSILATIAAIGSVSAVPQQASSSDKAVSLLRALAEAEAEYFNRSGQVERLRRYYESRGELAKVEESDRAATFAEETYVARLDELRTRFGAGAVENAREARRGARRKAGDRRSEDRRTGGDDDGTWNVYDRNRRADDGDDRRTGDRDDRKTGDRDDRKTGDRDDRKTGDRDDRKTGDRDDRKTDDRDDRKADDRDDRKADDRDDRKTGDRDDRKTDDRDDRKADDRDDRKADDRDDRKADDRDDRKADDRDDRKADDRDDRKADDRDDDRDDRGRGNRDVRDDDDDDDRDDRKADDRDDRRRDDREPDFDDDDRGREWEEMESEYEREMAQIQAEFDREMRQVEAEFERELAEAEREGKPEKVRSAHAKYESKRDRLIAKAEEKHSARAAWLENKMASMEDRRGVDICWSPTGDPEQRRTRTVSRATVESYLDLGATLGSCDEPTEPVDIEPRWRPSPIVRASDDPVGSDLPAPTGTVNVYEEVLRRAPDILGESKAGEILEVILSKPISDETTADRLLTEILRGR